jgi:hypothetical protein
MLRASSLRNVLWISMAGFVFAPSLKVLEAQRTDAVMTTEQVREMTPNDFLRVTFVPAGVSVTTLARPGSLRAFATATAFTSHRWR